MIDRFNKSNSLFAFFQCLIIMFVSCSQPLYGQVLLKETFDYPPDQTLAGRGEMVDGWAGPWRLKDGSDPGLVDHDTIRNFDRAFRTRTPTGSFMSGSGNILERALAQPIDLMQGPVWLGFVSDCDISSNRSKGTLALIDYAFDSLRQNRIEFGKTFNSTRLVVDGVGYYPRSLESTYTFGRWVVALITPESDGPVVYVWVDPDTATVPDINQADVKGRPLEMTNIDALQLIALDQKGLAWRIDDIYVGREYDDIVPGDWISITPGEIDRRAYEPFDYDPGIELSGQAGGFGFAGSWNLLNNFNHRVTEEKITFLGDRESRAPLMRLRHQSGNSNARYVRRLEDPVIDDGGIYWFGMIMDIDFSTNGNVAQAFLGNIDELGPSGPAGQYIQVGKSFANDRFSLGIPGNFVFVDDYPVGASYFVVVRISTSGDANNDNVDLWLNPDPEALSPPEDQISQNIQVNLNNGWNAIGFKIEGEAGINMAIDDIATGSTYRDVVPDYLITVVNKLYEEHSFHYYPNPGNGAVILEYNSKEKIDFIEVTDNIGRTLNKVDPEEFIPGLLQLVPETFPPGIYFIKTNCQGRIYYTTYIKVQ